MLICWSGLGKRNKTEETTIPGNEPGLRIES
jgi:hypothetical protein